MSAHQLSDERSDMGRHGTILTLGLNSYFQYELVQ